MKPAALFVLSMCLLNLAAQNPLVKQWDRRYGGIGREEFTQVIQCNNDGLLLAGYSFSDSTGDKTQKNWDVTPPQSSDFWIVHTNSFGNKLWDKRFGGSGAEDFRCVTQTPDKGFILGGCSESGVSGDKSAPNRGLFDYWVIKTDSNGIKVWDKAFGGLHQDFFQFVSSTKDGGFVLGGSSYSGISGDKTQPNWDITNQTSDFWVVKIDSLGLKQWDKRYGGSKDDGLSSIIQTTDNGYLLAGHTLSNASGDISQAAFGTIGGDFWLIKVDSTGTKQWDKRYGGTLSDIAPMSVIPCSNGGFLLAGFSYSDSSGNKTSRSKGGGDYWLIKIDSTGNMLWDKSFGGTAKEEFYNIVPTSDGGYLLSGDSYSNAGGDKSENNMGVESLWLVKIDSFGNKQWDKTVLTSGHDESGYAIQTKDGCYLVGGFSWARIGGEKTQDIWDTTATGSISACDYWMIKFCDTTHYPLQASVAQNNTSCYNLCNGTATITPANGYPPYSYQWQHNNDTIPTVTNLCPGVYTVVVTDTTGFSITNTITITAPEPPLISISADSTSVCIGDSSNICATSGFANYLWSNQATTECIAVSLAGTYYVTVTDNNNCTAQSNPLSISILPQPSIFPTANGDTLTAVGFLSYQWYLDGNIVNGAISNVLVAHIAGSYTVAVVDSNGCEAVSNPLIISSISELQQTKLNIYPNPANSHFFVQFDNQGNYTLEVFDHLGKNLSTRKGTNNTIAGIEIDMALYDNGIYYLKLSTTGLTKTGKVTLMK